MRKVKKPSNETPGKTKGGNCVARPLDRVMARSSRSYKMRDYENWKRPKK